jgi:hypothetical protein
VATGTQLVIDTSRVPVSALTSKARITTTLFVKRTTRANGSRMGGVGKMGEVSSPR